MGWEIGDERCGGQRGKGTGRTENMVYCGDIKRRDGREESFVGRKKNGSYENRVKEVVPRSSREVSEGKAWRVSKKNWNLGWFVCIFSFVRLCSLNIAFQWKPTMYCVSMIIPFSREKKYVVEMGVSPLSVVFLIDSSYLT